MRYLRNRPKSGTSITIILCVLVQIFASTICYSRHLPPHVGVISGLSGPVYVHTAHLGRHVPAASGMPLNIGDKIITKDGGWAQLLMTDRSVISLSEFTQFVIDDYRLNSPSHPSIFSSRLLQGGLKFISGLIGSSVQSGAENKMLLHLSQTTASIRGTSALANVTDTGDAHIILLSGQIDMLSSLGHPLGRLYRSGHGFDISSTGRLSDIFHLSSEQINKRLTTTKPPLPLDKTSSKLSQPHVSVLTPTPSLQDVHTQNISADTAFRYILADPILRRQLGPKFRLTGTEPSDLTAQPISGDHMLFDLILNGAVPLWAVRFSDGGIGNPYPDTTHSEFQHWEAFYKFRVAERYSGQIHFQSDEFPLIAQNGSVSRGRASVSAVLDYDHAELSGHIKFRDLHIEGIDFTSPETVTLAFPTFDEPTSLRDIPVGQALLSAPDTPDINAQATILFSLGSVGDDARLIDGRVGRFDARITPDGSVVNALRGEVIIAGQ